MSKYDGISGSRHSWFSIYFDRSIWVLATDCGVFCDGDCTSIVAVSVSRIEKHAGSPWFRKPSISNHTSIVKNLRDNMSLGHMSSRLATLVMHPACMIG